MLFGESLSDNLGQVCERSPNAMTISNHLSYLQIVCEHLHTVLLVVQYTSKGQVCSVRPVHQVELVKLWASRRHSSSDKQTEPFREDSVP